MDEGHGTQGPGIHCAVAHARLPRRAAAAAGEFGIRRVSRRFHQCVIGLLTALAASSWAPRVWALYEPEKLPNPTRRWALSVGFLGEYDDNIDTSSTNQQGSVRSHVSAVLQANIPSEETFFRMRYAYDAAYTPDRPTVKVI